MPEKNEKRKTPWVLGAVLLVVVVGVAVFFLAGDEDEGPRTDAPAPTPTDHHAPWDVTVVAQPIKGRPSRAERRLAGDHEEALAAAVSRVHDALILGVDEVSDLRGDYATADAADAMGGSSLLFEGDPSSIEAGRRRTRVAVEADRARRAVATTVIRATIDQDGSETEIAYRTTMWLERAGRGWRVFAFEGEGKPS